MKNRQKNEPVKKRKRSVVPESLSASGLNARDSKLFLPTDLEEVRVTGITSGILLFIGPVEELKN